MDKLASFERLILSLWTGVMVGIGYIAAPVLFKTLDDRKLAGSLAGQMFEVVGFIGLVCGGVLLMLRYKDVSTKLFMQWRGIALLLMLVLVAASAFVVQPMMADLKAMGIESGTDTAKQFGMLHGVSSILYMVTVICGCVLIFAGLKKDENKDYL